MVGQGHFEVEYQAGKFVPLSNDKIDAIKKRYFYDVIFQIGIKNKKSNSKKSTKEGLKVALQNMVKNVTMA